MTKPINILIIENDIDYQLYVENLLAKSVDESFQFNISRANTLKEGIELALYGKFDIILLDLELPDSNGIKTFETLIEKTNNTPVIVLTGVGGKKIEYDILNLGAQGYISKNKLNLDILKSSITLSIARFGFQKEFNSNAKTNNNISGLLKNKINNFSEREWFEKNFIKIIIADDEMVNLLVTKKML
jgi:DNA-binding NarL/FixJ family response regulator